MPVKSETIIRAQNGRTPRAGPGLSGRESSRSEEPDRPDLLGMAVPELERVALSLDEKPFRGRQIAEWLYRRGAPVFDAMTNLPAGFRARLAEEYRLGSLTERDRRETPDRKTRKLAFALRDRGVIESVFMSTPRRFTFCLSSQHGCGFACRFCATGRMGRGRNLTSGEIVEQALRLRNELPEGSQDFNVVMMGMGEPLENYDAVIQALRIMSDPSGMQVPARRITISTVGMTPQIQRLADERHRYRLAISLH